MWLTRFPAFALRVALFAATLLASASPPAFGQNAVMPSYGLFSADDFRLTTGMCADCRTLPQALWYFRGETIVVPKDGLPLAGFSRNLPVAEDLAAWAGAVSPGSRREYPPLIWVGAPETERAARLSDDARRLATARGDFGFHLVDKLPLNRAWFDASSRDFFHGRPLKMRGNRQSADFVARTLWPEDFRLPDMPVKLSLPADPAAIRAWVRAQPEGGARSPFAVESIWQRQGAGRQQAGQPVLGLMLNGAQGDDDEAHGGHFAVLTGRIGEQGGIDDWLVNNFYTLDAESEKGIVAAPVPLDNYLGDLNSGQAWYRPSYMLVVRLREARAAIHLQSALGRVYNQFYRHQFAYQHARANCTGISLSAVRGIGWQVPARGAESWLKAAFGLPWVALKEGSLAKGKATFDYLTEDRTRLYPAVAFEEMTADLLRLVGGDGGRRPSAFERVLAEDVEEILLVRVPQFPSSRPWGDYPVASSVEYTARLPVDPADQQIIPVPPRPFPAALRDPLSPAEPPLRSDYAAAAWGLALLVAMLLILRRLLA